MMVNHTFHFPLSSCWDLTWVFPEREVSSWSLCLNDDGLLPFIWVSTTELWAMAAHWNCRTEIKVSSSKWSDREFCISPFSVHCTGTSGIDDAPVITTAADVDASHQKKNDASKSFENIYQKYFRMGMKYLSLTLSNTFSAASVRQANTPISKHRFLCILQRCTNSNCCMLTFWWKWPN